MVFFIFVSYYSIKVLETKTRFFSSEEIFIEKEKNMSIEKSAIEIAMEAMNRKISPIGSSLQNVSELITNQSVFMNTSGFGAFKAMDDMATSIALGLGKGSSLALAELINSQMPKQFNPITASAIDIISRIGDSVEKSQRISESISLSVIGKKELFSAALMTPAITSALDIGEILSKGREGNFDIFNSMSDAFIKSVKPSSISIDLLDVYNSAYFKTERSFINPFVETNLKFLKAVDTSTFGQFSNFEGLYEGMKSLQEGSGNELASALEESANFDSSTDDYNTLLDSIIEKLSIVYDYVCSTATIPKKQKQTFLIGIQSLINFAKTQGIPLVISLAYAWHLSSETDGNVNRNNEELKSHIDTVWSKNEVRHDEFAKILESSSMSNDSLLQNAQTKIDSLASAHSKLNDKIDLLINELSGNK